MDRVPTAWMLRRDGKTFPVVQHLYGSPDCVEETLYAGEWLYRHTLRESARQAVLGLVRAYGLSLGAGAVAEKLRLSKKQKAGQARRIGSGCLPGLFDLRCRRLPHGGCDVGAERVDVFVGRRPARAQADRAVKTNARRDRTLQSTVSCIPALLPK